MTEDEMRKEIMRLRGEMSAACSCLHILYQFVIIILGDDSRDMLIDKLRNTPFDEDSVALMDDEWVEGIDRFRKRLTNLLAGDAVVHDGT